MYVKSDGNENKEDNPFKEFKASHKFPRRAHILVVKNDRIVRSFGKNQLKSFFCVSCNKL